MNENPLQYLISFEGGAVALLATALARHGNTVPSKNQSAFWRGFAELCGLPLSDSGPSIVKVEYNGADLLAQWDQWAILIEAKITAGSIRHGQLQNYYDRFRPLLGQDEVIKKASSMAVIFLTPSQVGKDEFDNSLSVRTPDQKRLLHWEEVLSLFEYTFSATQGEQQEEQTKFLSSLILQGTMQIRELLKSETTEAAWTPERRQCRDFARMVQARVSELWGNKELHFNPVWSDKNVHQIYANFSGNRAGNVYFDVYSDSKILEDDSEPSKLHGELYFKLAGRAPLDLKASFQTLDKRKIGALFRVDTVDIDLHAFKVGLTIERSEYRSKLCEQIAGLFCLCLIAFRSFME